MDDYSSSYVGSDDTTTPMLKIALIIVVIVMVLFYFRTMSAEHMQTQYYLDDFAMAYSDPTVYTYTSREKDILGNDAKEYYLENERNYLNGVAPGYFEGDSAFVNETGYLDMPAEFRPRPRTSDYEPERSRDYGQ